MLLAPQTLFNLLLAPQTLFNLLLAPQALFNLLLAPQALFNLLLTLQALVNLLLLAPCINGAAILTKELAAVSLQDSSKLSKVPQIPLNTNKLHSKITLENFLDFVDYDSSIVFDMGTKLREATLGADVETTAMLLDEKIGHIVRQGHESSIPEIVDRFAKQGHDVSFIATVKDLNILIMQRFDTAAAVMVHSFFDNSNLNIVPLVKVAMKKKFANLLRILQSCYLWSSREQFHWFLALSYESKWYDPHLWHTHSADWSNNLCAIFKADNLKLLNDILTAKIPSENPIAFDDNTLLNFIARHDSINIYQSPLCPFSFEKLATRLELLASAGSFKLLQSLFDSKIVENLHLENYAIPKKLPKDFDFFMKQGYRYLSAHKFITKACEKGRADILDLFYKMDPNLAPDFSLLTWAAFGGRLETLKWVEKQGLLCEHGKLMQMAAANNQFKVFQWLKQYYDCTDDDAQLMSNNAAERNRINSVKWIYEELKTVPESKSLCNTGSELLKWVESINPLVITPALASCANLSNLKWLSTNHPRVITDKVKETQTESIQDFEKMLWVFENWQSAPLTICWAARDNDLKSLKWAFEKFKMVPSNDAIEQAICSGYFEVLKWIHDNKISVLDKSTISLAIGYGNLEIAEYFEPILNPEKEQLSVDLRGVAAAGNLEIIMWVYKNKHYKIKHKTAWIKSAIVSGELDVINWALENEIVPENDDSYLKTSIQCGRLLMYQLLSKHIKNTIEINHRMILAFKSGNLGMLKYLVAENPESVKVLKDEETDANNHHLKRWLYDNGLWTA